MIPDAAGAMLFPMGRSASHTYWIEEANALAYPEVQLTCDEAVEAMHPDGLHPENVVQFAFVE